MAKTFKALLAAILALVMLSSVAMPVLAATEDTTWRGDNMHVNIVPGEDAYTHMIVADEVNGIYYYETSNHTILKSSGGAVHLIPIVDTQKVSGDWTPNGLWSPDGLYTSEGNNFEVVYCCDADTSSEAGVYYKRLNLEDSEYYSIAQAEKLRAILTNVYPYVSVEETKAFLAQAGFEFAEQLDRSEIISAVQAAVWSIANEGNGDPYVYNKTATTAQKLTWGGYMNEFASEITNFTDSLTKRAYKTPEGIGNRIDALKAFLLDLEGVKATDGQIVITKLAIVDTKIENAADKYNVDINVELNHGADENDTVVINAYVNNELVKSVAVGAETRYALELEASENDNIKVVVSGTQNLEKGVYFYAPKPADVDGDGIATSREVSQNLIGVASGDTAVYAEAYATVSGGKLNKTAKPLYEDKYTDVTLEIDGNVNYNPGGTVDIVIALGAGIANKTNTYDSVINLVEPLIAEGINVKLGLIAVEHYDDVAMELTALTADNYKQIIADGLATIVAMPAGPTNLHGNIVAAKEMLDADEAVPAENKFFYVIGTGRTYNFDNADGVPTTIVNQLPLNGNTYYYWGHYLWQSQRGRHTSMYVIPDRYENDYANFWEDICAWVEADGDTYAYSFTDAYDPADSEWFVRFAEENCTKEMNDYGASSRFGWVIGDLTNSGRPAIAAAFETIGAAEAPEALKHALNYERAQYEAYYAYKAMVDAGYTCQTLCSESPSYQNDSPWIKLASTPYSGTSTIQLGHSFMNFMAKLSGQDESTLLFIMTNRETGAYEMATDFFQKIDISKLTLDSVSTPFVEDFIGTGADYDFKFTGDLNKLALISDGIAYVATEILPANEGATASYAFTAPGAAKPAFTVDYFEGDGTTTERFVWYFYEKVESKISLTYQLELVKRNETPGKCFIAYTNQSAILYPNGNRAYGQVFPVPFIDYCNNTPPETPTPPTITFKPGQASNISFMLIDKATGKVEFLYKIDIEDETSFEIPSEDGKISAVFVKQSTSGMFWFGEDVDDAVVDAVIACLKANNPSYKGHNAIAFGAGDHTLEFKKNKFATYTFTGEEVEVAESEAENPKAEEPKEEEPKTEEPKEEEPKNNKKPKSNNGNGNNKNKKNK